MSDLGGKQTFGGAVYNNRQRLKTPGMTGFKLNRGPLSIFKLIYLLPFTFTATHNPFPWMKEARRENQLSAIVNLTFLAMGLCNLAWVTVGVRAGLLWPTKHWFILIFFGLATIHFFWLRAERGVQAIHDFDSLDTSAKVALSAASLLLFGGAWAYFFLVPWTA